MNDQHNEREQFMREWDKARNLLLKGYSGSLPRDIIENALDIYDAARTQAQQQAIDGDVVERVNELLAAIKAEKLHAVDRPSFGTWKKGDPVFEAITKLKAALATITQPSTPMDELQAETERLKLYPWQQPSARERKPSYGASIKLEEQAVANVRNACAAMGIKLGTEHGSPTENAQQIVRQCLTPYEK